MTMTKFKTLCIMAGLAMTTAAFAGDGTKENPYTVAELNAQKDALAASGNVVWVKADLKGLGVDGKSTDNADTTGADGKTVKNMAGLFGDESGTFVAYSWQILGQLTLDELTNTKDLLIALTYQKGSHIAGNKGYHVDDFEPADLHFSLEEVHNAVSVEIKNGYRGYHISSYYIIPEDIVAIKVSAAYNSNKGAYVNCETVFDGASETYVTPKNCALILLGNDGKHDLVLSTKFFDQQFSNGNTMAAGTKSGLNTYSNKNTYCFRFVATPEKVGFERNSENPAEVTLEDKSEVYVYVSNQNTNFWGKWTWETEDKKWISWTGKKYSDYHDTGINIIKGDTTEGMIYDLSGRKVTLPQKGIYIQDGKKYIAK